MPIPDYQSIMLPLLKLAAERELRIADAEDQIAELFAMDEQERDQLLPSGRQKVLRNRIHWAKTYLAKAGLLDTPRRGSFVISEAGRQLLSKNPPRIDNQMLLEIPSFSSFYRRATSVEETTPQDQVPLQQNAAVHDTPEEQIEAAFASLRSTLREELIARILQNSFQFFEGLIIDLLVAMGYGGSHQNAAAKLGRSGDGGVDGVINEDPLGLDKIYIQAKRYAAGNTVGRPEVQNFVGSLVGLHANKGVFVTTSVFSSQAIEYAKGLPQRVILIDGQKMAELMIDHDVGVRITRTLEFKRLDENFFGEED